CDTFSHQGDDEYGAEAHASRDLAALRKLLCLGLHVSDVERAPIQHGSARDRAADEGEGGGLRDCTVMGDGEEPVVVPSEGGAVVRLAQAGGALRDGVENRPAVRGWGTDTAD